jgi:hypothetical protein
MGHSQPLQNLPPPGKGLTIKAKQIGRRLFSLACFAYASAIVFMMLFCPTTLVYHHGVNGLILLFILILGAALDYF